MIMILVSFSSAEDASFNDVKHDDTFRSQGTENPLFRFFGDTRYMSPDLTCVHPMKWRLARMLPRELRRCTMSAGLILDPVTGGNKVLIN